MNLRNCVLSIVLSLATLNGVLADAACGYGQLVTGYNQTAAMILTSNCQVMGVKGNVADYCGGYTGLNNHVASVECNKGNGTDLIQLDGQTWFLSEFKVGTCPQIAEGMLCWRRQPQ